MNARQLHAKLKEKIRIRGRDLEKMIRQKHIAEGYLQRLREELDAIEAEAEEDE